MSKLFKLVLLALQKALVNHWTCTKKINEQLGIYEKMLSQAIKEERFEDATKLKEQIDLLTGKNN